MLHKLEDEFYLICKEIIEENKSLAEWAEIESDDLFRSGNYEGGFDSTEMAFCFSVFINGEEFFFQLSLDSIRNADQNLLTAVEIEKGKY